VQTVLSLGIWCIEELPGVDGTAGICGEHVRILAAEDETAMSMLIECGCDGAKGHFVGRPCGLEELTIRMTDASSGAAITAGHSQATTSAL
jgi:hypothetical protein